MIHNNPPYVVVVFVFGVTAAAVAAPISVSV
jgi:hypothetical protein